MVSKGQFLERPTLIPTAGGWMLEGMSHRGKCEPGLLVLPPSDEGGGMDHVVAAELVWAAVAEGHPTLRFNYRGVGASQGQGGDVSAKCEDAEAALRVFSENLGGGPIAAVSLGGSAAVLTRLAQAHPGLAGICFVSPLHLQLDELARAKRPLLAVLGQHEQRVPRAALVSAVDAAGGRVELVPGADASFQKNLNLVGRLVAEWVATLADAC